MTQWTQKRTRVQFGTDDDAVAVDVGDAERARLIAAAPELLEALKKALRYGGLFPELAEEARAAIAKATDA